MTEAEFATWLSSATDCRELERSASVEVDRINSTTDRVIVDEATNRFQRIVAVRDAIC